MCKTLFDNNQENLKIVSVMIISGYQHDKSAVKLIQLVYCNNQIKQKTVLSSLHGYQPKHQTQLTD